MTIELGEYCTPFSFFKGGIRKKIASGTITHAQYIETITGLGDYVLDDWSLPDKIKHVRSVYEAVRAGRQPTSDYDQAKADLPWILPQGSVIRRRRSGELWKHVGFEPSGLFNLDIDVKDNRDAPLFVESPTVWDIDPKDDSLDADLARADIIKITLIHHAKTSLHWIGDIALSPSGTGYKINAIIKKFPADDGIFARYTLDSLGQAILDAAGIRIDYGVKSCWPCYLTYDPDAWVNPAPEVWMPNDEDVEVARRKIRHADAPDMALCDPELVAEALEYWRRTGMFGHDGEPVGTDGVLHHDVHRNIVWGVVHAVGYDAAQDLLEGIGFADVCSSSFNLKKLIEDYRHAPGADTAPITWDSLWPLYGIPTAMATPEFECVDEAHLEGPAAVFAEDQERRQIAAIFQATTAAQPQPPSRPDREAVRKAVESLPPAQAEVVQVKREVIEEDGESIEMTSLPEGFEAYKGPEELSTEDINVIEKLFVQIGVFADRMPRYANENISEFLRTTFTDGKGFYELVSNPGDPEGRQTAQCLSPYLMQCKMARLEIPRDPPAARLILVDHVNLYHRVAGMAPIHFSNEGVIEFQGNKILNNSTMRLVEPLPWTRTDRRVEFGEGFPKVGRMMARIYNSTPNAVEERQLDRLLTLMSHDYKGCYYGKPRKGLMLGLIGPINCGKTYFTRAVYGGVKGGAADKAENYFARLDTSNKDTLSRSIIMVDDRPRLHRDKERQFLESIKQFVSSGTIFFRSFYTDYITVPAEGSRLVIALNDDPESLQVLPQLGKSMRDKVLFLRLEVPEEPFTFPTEAEIREELPGLARYLLQYEPPPELTAERYGVMPFVSKSLEHYTRTDSKIEPVTLALDELVRGCIVENLVEGWKSGAPDYHKGIGFYRGPKSGGRLWLALTGGLFRDYYRQCNGNNSHLDHANHQLKVLASQVDSAIIMPTERLRAQTPVRDDWSEEALSEIGGAQRVIRAKFFIDLERYWQQNQVGPFPEKESEETFKL